MAQIVIKQVTTPAGDYVQVGPPGFIVEVAGTACAWSGVAVTAVANVAGSATINGTTDFTMSAAGRYRLKATTALGDVFVDALAYDAAALAKIPSPPTGEPMTDARRLRIFASLARETTWFDGTAASLVSRPLYAEGG